MNQTLLSFTYLRQRRGFMEKQSLGAITPGQTTGTGLYAGKMHDNFNKADKKQNKYDGKHKPTNNKMMKFTLLKVTLSISFCLHAKAGGYNAFHYGDR